jgi:hypothetical protein
MTTQSNQSQNAPINQQVLHNPIHQHAYYPINAQLPIQIQTVLPDQTPSFNQNLPFNLAPNHNLPSNPLYAIPQNFGNSQLSNSLPNNTLQNVPVQPDSQQINFSQSYYNQVSMNANMPQSPIQPAALNYLAQNGNQFNIYQ